MITNWKNLKAMLNVVGRSDKKNHCLPNSAAWWRAVHPISSLEKTVTAVGSLRLLQIKLGYHWLGR